MGPLDCGWVEVIQFGKCWKVNNQILELIWHLSIRIDIFEFIQVQKVLACIVCCGIIISL